MMTSSDYDRGLQDGLRAAIDLCRAGATADDLAGLIQGDTCEPDPHEYQDRLRELRKTLGLGFGDLPEEVSP